MKRRAYLGLLGAGALAGCSGGDDGSAGTDSTDTTETSTESRGNDGGDAVADPSSVAFSQRWVEDFDFEDSVTSQNFAADGSADTLVMGAEWGLAALDMADSSRTWEKDEWDDFIDIQVDSEGVMVYTETPEIVSFDPSDGSERWRTSTTNEDNVVFNTELTASYFVAESADGIAVYERGSGDVALELDESAEEILATDEVLVVMDYTETTAFDIPSGNERWTTESFISLGATIDDGRLIEHKLGAGSDEDSSLTAIDLSSGAERWSENLGSVRFNQASITTEDGVATFLSQPLEGAQTLHGHDLADGSQLWTRDAGDLFAPFEPVTANGVIIAPSKTDGQSQIQARNVQTGELLDSIENEVAINMGVAVDRTFVAVETTSAAAYDF